ncbi:hypothetical protein [Yoonia sp. SS1-5]|uniref:Uncharacterized protein n=1 Tax=Yoonia rhodophyticola TaxID=3137370 RepID=A0AAN0MMN1_9RHOB
MKHVLDDTAAIASQLYDVGPVDILIKSAGVMSPARQSPRDMDLTDEERAF